MYVLGVAFLFTKMSGAITDTLIEGGVIADKERGLYLYCFGMLLETAANLLTTLLIGVLLGKPTATLIFMAIFIPLRSTAGGYHCETAGRCYFLSVSVFLSVILLYERLSLFPTIVSVALGAADFIVVALFSPVESVHKPLDGKTKRVYRFVSILILFVSLAAAFVLLKSGSSYGCAVLVTVTASAVSMLAGKIKRIILSRG